MVQPKDNLLKAATALVQAGISVIPIEPDGNANDGKQPIIVGQSADGSPQRLSWQRYQKRLPNQKELEAWFTVSGRGIAVISGEVSGRLELLDFDEPGLFEQFVEACRDNDLGDVVDKCPLDETPSGGRHLYYRCEDEVGPRVILAQKHNPDNPSKPKIRIETRSEGNYTVVPPTPAACHRLNKPYRMLCGKPIEAPVLSAYERAGLRAMARLFNEYVAPSDQVKTPNPRGRQPSGLRPGDDYNERGDAEAILQRHGWTRITNRSGVNLYRRPGKSKGQSATFGTRPSGGTWLHVFSSSAAPFQFDKNYNPFQIYALLEHSGDFAAAAKALAAQGYGSPAEPPTRPAQAADDAYGDDDAPHPLTPAPSGPAVADAPWEDPIPLASFDLPAFPIRALPDPLRSMAAAVAELTQVPIDMAASVALGVCAAATRGRVRIDVGGTFPVHTNTYTVVVAKPSEHKSSVLKLLAAPLYQAEHELITEAKPKVRLAKAKAENLEAEIGKLRKQLMNPKLDRVERQAKEDEIDQLVLQMAEIPNLPQILVDDSTTSALGQVMADQPDNSAALISDEGGFFDTLANSGNSKTGGHASLDLVLKGFNQEPTRVNRTSRAYLYIPKPALTICLMVQPSVIEAFSEQKQFRGKGLLSRFMYVYPKSIVGSRTFSQSSIPNDVREEYYQAVRSLFAIPNPVTAEDPGAHHVIRIARQTAAMSLWAEFNANLETRIGEEGDLFAYDDWGGKLSGQAARLAGLFHVLQHQNIASAMAVPISDDNMCRALAIAQYLIPHALRTFGEIVHGGSNKLAMRIDSWILKRGITEFKFQQVRDSHNDRSDDEIDLALELLCKYNRIRQIIPDRSKGGRPGRLPYHVNPKVLGAKK
jgi:hypothetical protein